MSLTRVPWIGKHNGLRGGGGVCCSLRTSGMVCRLGAIEDPMMHLIGSLYSYRINGNWEMGTGTMGFGNLELGARNWELGVGRQMQKFDSNSSGLCRAFSSLDLLGTW